MGFLSQAREELSSWLQQDGFGAYIMDNLELLSQEKKCWIGDRTSHPEWRKPGTELALGEEIQAKIKLKRSGNNESSIFWGRCNEILFATFKAIDGCDALSRIIISLHPRMSLCFLHSRPRHMPHSVFQRQGDSRENGLLIQSGWWLWTLQVTGYPEKRIVDWELRLSG